MSGRRRRGRCACRRRGCTSACWPPACTARFSVPRKIGLNWFIPGVGEQQRRVVVRDDRRADGTNVWPCFLTKKSMNCWRISRRSARRGLLETCGDGFAILSKNDDERHEDLNRGFLRLNLHGTFLRSNFVGVRTITPTSALRRARDVIARRGRLRHRFLRRFPYSRVVRDRSSGRHVATNLM